MSSNEREPYDIQAQIGREKAAEDERFRMVPGPFPKPHRYHEHWINLNRLERVQHGNWPRTLIITFDSPAAVTEALESLCTGRELRGGGIRHDSGKHCPVHPDHDDR